jgi:hypothetical protein
VGDRFSVVVRDIVKQRLDALYNFVGEFLKTELCFILSCGVFDCFCGNFYQPLARCRCWISDKTLEE